MVEPNLKVIYIIKVTYENCLYKKSYLKVAYTFFLMNKRGLPPEQKQTKNHEGKGSQNYLLNKGAKGNQA